MFLFKYQVDKDKYVKFLIQIHQTKLFEIILPVEKSIWFLGWGKAIIWPIVGGGLLKNLQQIMKDLLGFFAHFWGGAKFAWLMKFYTTIIYSSGVKVVVNTTLGQIEAV